MNDANDSSAQRKPRQRPVVAIDGPAGAGKSTLAGHLARRFGLLNLETGAMYRALALKAIESDLDLDDEAALAELCGHTEIALDPTHDGNRVLLDGSDVTRRVRDNDVTAAASRASVHPAVRQAMVARQRALGAAGGVVMEGRDIGTAVFPDAEVKIFLDAKPEVRGQRRFKQVTAQGRRQQERRNERPQEPTEAPTVAAVLQDLRERDERDRERSESPLRPAEDAIHVDSTVLTLEQVKVECEAIVRRWFERSAEDAG